MSSLFFEDHNNLTPKIMKIILLYQNIRHLNLNGAKRYRLILNFYKERMSWQMIIKRNMLKNF